MRGKLLRGILTALVVVAGYPYAGLVLNRVIGTATVAMIEHDGTPRSMVMGPAAPLPAWLPQLPRAWTVTATHWLPSPDRPIAGGHEVLTHTSVDEIKRFYAAALAEAGFVMRDDGIGTLTPPVAVYLGIDNTLVGTRADGLVISVVTRSAGGLIFPSRLVQLNWTVPQRAAAARP